jgi:hypothetical protein
MTIAENSNPPLTVTPASVIMSPGEHVAFAADGGAGWGFAWSIDPNVSGAAISDAGVYVAGPLGGGTDVIVLADAFGNKATASVALGPSQGQLADEAHAPITVPAGISSLEGGGGCQAAAGPASFSSSLSLAFGGAVAVSLLATTYVRFARRRRQGRMA